MGAQQSSFRDQGGSASASAPAKTCYYELLGVERDANDEEYLDPVYYCYPSSFTDTRGSVTDYTVSRIKKAYKKKALQLHPDRNFGDVESATQRFAQVQSAYEVLSDPQERAWYDSHREAILHGADAEDFDDHIPEFNNIRLTPTEEIYSLIRRFNVTIPFTDEPAGFFGIASETFAHLADEEAAAGEYDAGHGPCYPPFGDSIDEYETVVRPFYAGWAGFSTKKTFAWKDKYRLSDAPDRRVRRLMEKENKKLREDATREFNDAVRFLVAFVRKRDPRYLPNSQSATERQAAMRNAAAAQAARSRAANQSKFNNDEAVPEWARSREEDDGGPDSHFSQSEAESEIEQIECVVCDKTFKSEKSYQAHEKSKKHSKAVQQLRRQMKKEGAELDIDSPTSGIAAGHEIASGVVQVGHEEEATSQLDQAMQREDTLNNEKVGVEAVGMLDDTAKLTDFSTDDDSNVNDDDSGDYAPRATIQQRFLSEDKARLLGDLNELPATKLDGLSLANTSPEGDTAPAKRLGKAKEKRAKKAAKGAGAESQGHTCGVCKEGFSSNTQLFKHINKEGHAELKSANTSSNKKNKKRN